jgi:hypothetical protein
MHKNQKVDPSFAVRLSHAPGGRAIPPRGRARLPAEGRRGPRRARAARAHASSRRAPPRRVRTAATTLYPSVQYPYIRSRPHDTHNYLTTTVHKMNLTTLHMRATHPRRLYTHHTNQRAGRPGSSTSPGAILTPLSALAQPHAPTSCMLSRRRSSLVPPPTTRYPLPPAHGPADSGRGDWRRWPDLRGAGGERECDPASESRTLLAGVRARGKQALEPARSLWAVS